MSVSSIGPGSGSNNSPPPVIITDPGKFDASKYAAGTEFIIEGKGIDVQITGLQKGDSVEISGSNDTVSISQSTVDSITITGDNNTLNTSQASVGSISEEGNNGILNLSQLSLGSLGEEGNNGQVHISQASVGSVTTNGKNGQVNVSQASVDSVTNNGNNGQVSLSQASLDSLDDNGNNGQEKFSQASVGSITITGNHVQLIYSDTSVGSVKATGKDDTVNGKPAGGTPTEEEALEKLMQSREAADAAYKLNPTHANLLAMDKSHLDVNKERLKIAQAQLQLDKLSGAPAQTLSADRAAVKQLSDTVKIDQDRVNYAEKDPGATTNPTSLS